MRVLNALLQLFAKSTHLKDLNCGECILYSLASTTMYEAFFNNKFTDALVFYVFLLLLLLGSPFLFIWELFIAIQSCFQRGEDMSQKVVLITGASSGLGEVCKP